MNVALIDKLLKQIKEEIEPFFQEVDKSIYDISTSMDSTIAVKRNILNIYMLLNVLKEDLHNFRDGKEIITNKKILKGIQELFKNKDLDLGSGKLPPFDDLGGGFSGFGKF